MPFCHSLFSHLNVSTIDNFPLSSGGCSEKVRFRFVQIFLETASSTRTDERDWIPCTAPVVQTDSMSSEDMMLHADTCGAPALNSVELHGYRMYCVCSRLIVVCVCVFSSHLFWTSGLLDVPAGVTR